MLDGGSRSAPKKTAAVVKKPAVKKAVSKSPKASNYSGGGGSSYTSKPRAAATWLTSGAVAPAAPSRPSGPSPLQTYMQTQQATGDRPYNDYSVTDAHQGEYRPDWETSPAEREAEKTSKKAREDHKIQMEAKRAMRAGNKGDFKEMSWKEYNALSKEDRAAVDFNGLLQEAYNKDRSLLNLDKDGNGEVSLSEAGDKAKGYAGYGSAYERIFGKPGEGEDIGFAPNIVGLLNGLDVKDEGGILREYTSEEGGGFITDADIKAGRHINGMEDQTSWGYHDPRGEWMSRLAQNTSSLEKALEKGRVKASGLDLRASLSGITPDQRSTFVDNLAGGLSDPEADLGFKMSGRDRRLNEKEGMDVSSLLNRGDVENLNSLTGLYNELYKNMTEGVQQADGSWSPPIDPALMQDKEFIGGTLERAGLKLDDWLKFTRNHQGEGTAGETDALDELVKGSGK